MTDDPRDSPVLTPQWERDCPYCGGALARVWPDADTERVELEACFRCGAGPVVVERDMDDYE